MDFINFACVASVPLLILIAFVYLCYIGSLVASVSDKETGTRCRGGSCGRDRRYQRPKRRS